MPITANITAATGIAAVFTFPPGTRIIIIQNESDTAIRFRLNKVASATVTVGSVDAGLLLPPAASGIPSVFSITLPEAARGAIDLFARQEAGGNKLLTVEGIPDL